MFDNSSSSLGDVSREWKEKADLALKESHAQLSRGTDKNEQSRTRRAATRTAELKSTKMNADMKNIAKEIDENHKSRQTWAKAQIQDINEQTRQEIEAIEQQRQYQQELFQAQLHEKNQYYEKAVLEKREEAARLRSMVSNLQSQVSVIKNEAKTDIEEAKRKAEESAAIIKATRQQQIKQTADLVGEIDKENVAHNLAVKQALSQKASNLQHKKDQLARLQANFQQIQSKLKEKEGENDGKFRQQYRVIKDLRAELEHAKDIERQRQEELSAIRRECASASRKISARKNEAASLKRQIAVVAKDNQELQGEIVKLETQMFPTVFRPQKA